MRGGLALLVPGMRLHFVRATPFAALFASLVAVPSCAATGDTPTTQREDDQKVKPSGLYGRGTVTLEIAASQPTTFTTGGRTYAYAFAFNGVEIEPGKPTLVPAGTGSWHQSCLEIRLTSNGGRISSAYECIWQLPAGGEVTVQLGTAKLWWANHPEARSDVFVAVDVGTTTLERRWEGQRYPMYSTGGSYDLLSTNDVPLFLVPGDYAVARANPSMPERSFTVAALRQTDVEVDLRGQLGSLQFTYEAPEFPDAASGATLRCWDRLRQKSWTRSFEGRPGSSTIMVDGEGADCEVSFVHDRVTERVRVARGGTAEIAVRRLEVDDVFLRDENRTVPGVFDVRRRDATGWGPMLLGATPTRRGLDLPRGHYEVWVTHETARGAAQRRYELDL